MTINYFSHEDDEKLRALTATGITYKEIAEKMGRSKSSITKRIIRLGLQKRERKPWDLQSLQFVYDNYPRINSREIAKTLGRSITSIRSIIPRIRRGETIL